MGNEIKSFWDSQAQRYKEESCATNPDTLSFQLEIDAIRNYLKNGLKVLEFGCGNGYASHFFVKEFELNYIGVDYSEKMVTTARNALKKIKKEIKSNVRYEVGNIIDYKVENDYDLIFTDRCLINLKSTDEQINAIKNIHFHLKHNGLYLMMECSKKSLLKINQVRRRFNLEEIKERWHNFYLEEDYLLNKISEFFSLTKIDSFASTYFLISRTINALITSSDGGIDYLSNINRIASKLPPIGDYAPLKMFVLKKI